MNFQTDQDISTFNEPGNPMVLMSQFYQQVVEIKCWIENGKLPMEVAQQLRLQRTPTDEEMAEAVSLRLQRWIEQTRMRVSKLLTDRECNRIDEALFVMAALADELFIIELDWPGKRHWQAVMLEERIFRTCFAGEHFFTGANRLLRARTLDPQQQQLVAVYLLALRLGFAGRFREQPQRLAYFRQQLFKRISGGHGDESQPLYPQAYQHQLKSWEQQRLAPLASWYRIMGIGAIVYLVMGWGIWLTLKGSWM